MKKLLTFILLGIALFTSAQPNACVQASVSPGYVCSPSSLGQVNPCDIIPFVVTNITPPTGYDYVGKFEWFVNGVSAKTTTDPNDAYFHWVVTVKPANVYCKVTYKKFNGDLSAPYP